MPIIESKKIEFRIYKLSTGYNKLFVSNDLFVPNDLFKGKKLITNDK